MPASTAADNGGQTIIFAGTLTQAVAAARQSSGGSRGRTDATERERARAEGSLACSRHHDWEALCCVKSLILIIPK